MKKILLLLSVFQFFASQSQVYTSKSVSEKNKFDLGVYTSEAKGQNIKLTINADKTYDMSFFFGNYEVKNDTIYFKNNFQNSQKFVFKPIQDAPFSSSLKLKLNYDLSYYYSTEIYIGTQSDENRKVFYKQLKEYFKEKNTDLTQQNIEVEKSKFLYIVDAKYNNSTVFKFEIPETVNEAKLEYNPYTNSETKLSGYIDSNNEFVISDGKTPILFDFQKEDSDNPKIKTNLKAVEVKADNNWLKENGFSSLIEEVGVATESYSAPYVFKHKITSSLSNAQTEIKKSISKFLIVVYDPKNKNAKTEFDTYIRTSEESISSYMYNEYNPTYDIFNFYLASEKDKNLLSKNNVISDQEIVVLNNNGEMVYHTNGSLEEKKDLFSVYNSIQKELKVVNEKLELDKIISNKNASVKEIKTALRKILNFESDYGVVSSPAVDAVMFTPPTIKQDDSSTPVVEEKVSYETVVDSVAMPIEAVYDDSYNIIKDKQNLYQFKSSKDAVMAKWKKVLDNQKNSKTYDKEIVQILKSELSNTGFSQRMFPKIGYNSTDMDFELLDYVFANYKLLLNPPAEKVEEESVKPEVSDYDYSYYYEQDIKRVLNTFFSTNNHAQNTNLDKVLTYYKKYLVISDYEATAVQNYLSALRLNIDSNNNKKEYLETYEKYFDSIVKENTSIIENLDAAFSNRTTSDYSDWTTYKNSFANLANEVSWYLVEKSTDVVYLEKAIKWSETSLLLEKNNHYYLDTLAQIYYKNGDKQKAIATEQKAIDAIEDGTDSEEYKAVLERMKNGTY